MKQSIKEELTEHLNEVIRENIEINNDGSVTYYRGDMHHKAFNQDYYIIGYYQAEEWLKEHGLSTFEAIEFATILKWIISEKYKLALIMPRN